jgi:flagellar protein FlaF
MHHAAKAYGQVAKQTANPRELEANLLLSAAAKLQALRDGTKSAPADFEAALLYNRKLWSIFVTSATQKDHPLPPAVRQNIANLGIFVLGHTMAIANEFRPELLGPLISINREVAAGLLGRG